MNKIFKFQFSKLSTFNTIQLNFHSNSTIVNQIKYYSNSCFINSKLINKLNLNRNLVFYKYNDFEFDSWNLSKFHPFGYLNKQFNQIIRNYISESNKNNTLPSLLVNENNYYSIFKDDIN